MAKGTAFAINLRAKSPVLLLLRQHFSSRRLLKECPGSSLVRVANSQGESGDVCSRGPKSPCGQRRFGLPPVLKGRSVVPMGVGSRVF